jgi:hypothetical protein
MACMGEDRKVYKVLVGKSKGKRPFERLRHRWEDGIKMDHTEIGWEVVDWIHLAQDRGQWRALVNMEMNLRFLASQNQIVTVLQCISITKTNWAMLFAETTTVLCENHMKPINTWWAKCKVTEY